MSTTNSNVDEAFRAARSLKPAEQLELISRLWENVRCVDGFRLSDREWAEIKRRSAELDGGTTQANPWDVVRDSVRSRIASHE